MPSGFPWRFHGQRLADLRLLFERSRRSDDRAAYMRALAEVRDLAGQELLRMGHGAVEAIKCGTPLIAPLERSET